MTEQIQELLMYNNRTYTMDALPLTPYLQKKGISFTSQSTACWRGYIATWEIKNDKLYLIGLEGYLKNHKQVNLRYLFPFRKRVFARWFSGEIQIMWSAVERYAENDTESMPEELLLEFRNGRLIKNRQLANPEKN